jgi:hypothetical protein
MDIQPELNIPSGANIRQSGTYPIVAGYKTITPTNYQTTNVPGNFNGTLGFNITPPSPDTALSRWLYIRATVELTIRSNLDPSVVNPTSNTPSTCGFPKPDCMWTDRDAIRAFPLSRSTVTTQVQINDGTFSIVTNRILEPLLRCNTTAADWANLSGAPVGLDNQSDYMQGNVSKLAYSTANNGYAVDAGTVVERAYVNNDPFLGSTGTNFGKYAQASQFAGFLTKQAEESGSNKSFHLDKVEYGTGANLGEVKVTFTTIEPLFIPPLTPQVHGEEYAIRGVSTLALNLLLENPELMHMYDNSQWVAEDVSTAGEQPFACNLAAGVSLVNGSAPTDIRARNYYCTKTSRPPQGYSVTNSAGATIVNKLTYSAKFSSTSPPAILCTWYTMPDAKAYMPDSKLFYSSYRVDPYTASSAQVDAPKTINANGADQVFEVPLESQNIQFGNIPQRIIITLQPQYNVTGGTVPLADSARAPPNAKGQVTNSYEIGVAERTFNFGSITGVEIEYDVQSGILSGASPYQLWEMSHANGYRGTFLDWTKGFGSVLILDVGKNLPMLNQNEPPGSRVTKNFKIKVRGYNQSTYSNRNYKINIFTISSGIMTIQNQGTSVNNAPVTQAAVASAYAGSRIDSKFANTPMYGNGYSVGGKFLGIRRFTDKVRGVASLASKLPGPYGRVAHAVNMGAKAYQSRKPSSTAMVRAHGYGYGGGDASGGALVSTQHLRDQIDGSAQYDDEQEDYEFDEQ